MSQEEKEMESEARDADEAPVLNPKRCLACTETLTNENAREHYRVQHPQYYVLIYCGDEMGRHLHDPANVAAIQSFALCGKCRASTPPCVHCAPLFDRMKVVQ